MGQTSQKTPWRSSRARDSNERRCYGEHNRPQWGRTQLRPKRKTNTTDCVLVVREPGDYDVHRISQIQPLDSALRDKLDGRDSSSSETAQLRLTCTALEAKVSSLQEQLEVAAAQKHSGYQAPPAPVCEMEYAAPGSRAKLTALQAFLDSKDAIINQLRAEAAACIQSHERHLQQLQDSCHGKIESIRADFAAEIAATQEATQNQEAAWRSKIELLQQEVASYKHRCKALECELEHCNTIDSCSNSQLTSSSSTPQGPKPQDACFGSTQLARLGSALLSTASGMPELGCGVRGLGITSPQLFSQRHSAPLRRIQTASNSSPQITKSGKVPAGASVVKSDSENARTEAEDGTESAEAAMSRKASAKLAAGSGQRTGSRQSQASVSSSSDSGEKDAQKEHSIIQSPKEKLGSGTGSLERPHVLTDKGRAEKAFELQEEVEALRRKLAEMEGTVEGLQNTVLEGCLERTELQNQVSQLRAAGSQPGPLVKAEVQQRSGPETLQGQTVGGMTATPGSSSNSHPFSNAPDDAAVHSGSSTAGVPKAIVDAKPFQTEQEQVLSNARGLQLSRSKKHAALKQSLKSQKSGSSTVKQT